jgi:hypothetical protein
LGAVRIAAELAGSDLSGEIGRDSLGRPGEDAFTRIRRRGGDFVDDDIVHIELGKDSAEATELVHDEEPLID